MGERRDGSGLGESSGALVPEDLRALVEAGRAVVSDLEVRGVVQAVVDAARSVTGAEVGALLYGGVGGSGRSFARHARSGGPPEALEELARVPGEGRIRMAFIDGTTVRLHDASEDGDRRVRSCLATGVAAPDGELLGVLVLGHSEAGRFERRHELLVEGIAGFASIGLVNAFEFRAQQEIAQELQQAMLPAVGFHEGVEVAVRYRPAAHRAKVGGDWYDVHRLADGRLALTVGDVAGHNVSAAARMGAVRNALGVHVRREVDPGRSLLALEEHLVATGQKGFVTVVQAVLDPADASVVVARAGHPPPLVVPATGDPYFVGGDPSPPVGVGLLRDPPEELRVELGLNDTMLFFTDGLVEQRRTATDVRMNRLRDLAATLTDRTAASICDELLGRFVGPSGGDDDVAMLAIRPLFLVPTYRPTTPRGDR